ncbi:hypothetical protein BDV28DRAFT_163617 [Aspergillus coremiiformis]|uniref:Uncharacterized protein n=1 Tax=Aspergillus coremiiformis TaxID=138285 RepID=A0A5N6YWE5_9EURO|nr:hypothetical protein BDV28DRAFT_163617 [Aspergillus coremiiformis]
MDAEKPSNSTEDPSARPQPGRFRFKSDSGSRSGTHGDSGRRRRRHRRRSASPRGHDDPPDGLSADAAFRESLFDALGDDEGAAYWESVYGQPIHRYAVPRGSNGELEQMTEEEYARYVRTKMWERTREGMLEEQERVRARRTKREEGLREKKRFERAMEESLRRGQERRRRKAWAGAWEAYRASWEEVDRAVGDVRTGGEGKLGHLLFWPVESGKRRDVGREAIEEFMRHASGDGDREVDLLAVLKAERVRWHPDKIQHRYGALGIDEVVMSSVTEVFQIIDRLWTEVKGKQS